MISKGLCIPCEMSRAKGIICVNGFGISMLEDFREYMDGCVWWNSYVQSDNSPYETLRGFYVQQVSSSREVDDHIMRAEDALLCVNIIDVASGEILMSFNKTDGRMDISTCKEQFIGFAEDWNKVIDEDVEIILDQGKLAYASDVRSVVVGSIFDEWQEVEA